MFLIHSLLLLASCRASTLFYYPDQTRVLTVCPDDYVPRNGCVTPDHLYNMSDTTYRFVPAFKMLPDQVIRFYAVSNIVLDTAGPDRASISCLGENSGFYFERVQGLTIRNLEFIDCAVRNVSYDAHYIIICIFFPSHRLHNMHQYLNRRPTGQCSIRTRKVNCLQCARY